MGRRSYNLSFIVQNADGYVNEGARNLEVDLHTNYSLVRCHHPRLLSSMPDLLGGHTALLAAVGLLLWRIARVCQVVCAH